MSKSINYILNNPEQITRNNLLALVSFHKTKQGKNAILSKLITTFANEILAQIPNDFVAVTVDNIRRNSKDENPNVKFDLDFELNPPIKPFVEYEIVINETPTHTQKVTFQLNTSMSMNDLEIKYEEKQKIIWLGETTIFLELVLFSFDAIGKPSMPFSLGSQKITIDLSTFKISAE